MAVGEVLSTIGNAATDLTKGFDWSKFLQSDQFSNLLGAGANIWGAYNANEAMDKQFKLADQSMAMSQDAYNRDKEAEQRRQNLNFA